MQLMILVLAATTVLKGDGCSEAPVPTSCLRPNDERDIPYEDIGGRGVMTFSSDSQVLATSYKFTCCGNVTQWRTFVDPGRNGDQGYHITFQVWRVPSNMDLLNNGCYNLVGENTFHDIILGDHGEVCESPTPEERITVQPGDVVGFYQRHDSGGKRGIQIHQMYRQEEVWFQNDPQPTGEEQCQFSVGPGQVLQSFTEHAPILSVSVESFPCESPTTKEVMEALTTTTPTEKEESTLYDATTKSDTFTPAQSTAVPEGSKKEQENTNSSFEERNPFSETSEISNSTVADLTLSTKTKEPVYTDQTYRYPYTFIASIVMGTTSALLLVLLVITCILLSISLMKHRLRNKPKIPLDERLDICDSLMYNDIYMELKGQCGLSSNSSQESVRYPPAVPITLPFPGASADQRYTLSSRSANPPSYPPKPPTKDNSSGRHYMNTMSIFSRSNSYSSLSTESRNDDQSIAIMPYAVTDSCLSHPPSSATAQQDMITTSNNIAYNALLQKNS